MNSVGTASLPSDVADGVRTGFGSGSSRGVVIALCVVGVAFLAMFWHWFHVQNRLSLYAPEDWGHAYMVPLISLWLLWQKRAVLAGLPKRVYPPGLLAVLFGVVTYAYMTLGFTNHMAQGAAWIISLYGVVLFAFGPAFARAAFIPIAYLAFAVTISTQIMTIVTFRLQFLASEGSWAMLSLIGALADFKVEIDGNVLRVVKPGPPIEEFPLNVAEACSGMRMVVAFFALSFAAGLVACREWWQRIATVLLAAPVAIFMNMIRVTVLGLLTLFNPDLAAGEAHTLIGTLLLFPSLLLFLGIVWVLNRVVKQEKKAGTPPGVSVVRWPGRRGLIGSAVTLGLVLAGSAAGFQAALVALDVRLEKKPIYADGGRTLLALPTETARWVRVGKDRIETKEVVAELGTENYLTREYETKQPDATGRKRRLQLHAAYYTGQIETVPHVPDRCFVGGGMQVSGTQKVLPVEFDMSSWRADDTVDAALAGESGVLYAVRPARAYSDYTGSRGVRMPRDMGPGRPPSMVVTEFTGGGAAGGLVAGYFFIANGGTVARAEGVRALAFDLTSEYAYYLKVQVTSSDVSSAEELAAVSAGLLGELMPEIMRCVPDWVEVQEGRYP